MKTDTVVIKEVQNEIPILFKNLDESTKRTQRDWGQYHYLYLTEKFAVKHLIMKSEGSQSVHRHYHRTESWVVVSGTVLVDIFEEGNPNPVETKIIAENYSFTLDGGTIHRLRNPGVREAVIIETQWGETILQSDIQHYRIQDNDLVAENYINTALDTALPFSDLNHPDSYLLGDNRPWGCWRTITEQANYKVKVIKVEPNQRLSDQLHYYRNEHWIVTSGTAILTKEKDDGSFKDYTLLPGQSKFIPMTKRHRLQNPGKIPALIVEVQVGSYLGEDDIVRISDDYGRV